MTMIASACQELCGVEIKLVVGPYDRFSIALDQAMKDAGAKKVDYGHNKLSLSRKFAEHFNEDDIAGKLKERLEVVISRIREWST